MLLKRQAQISQKLSSNGGDGVQDAATLRIELAAVEQEMVDYGGLEWYQRGACCRLSYPATRAGKGKERLRANPLALTFCGFRQHPSSARVRIAAVILATS